MLPVVGRISLSLIRPTVLRTPLASLKSKRASGYRFRSTHPTRMLNRSRPIRHSRRRIVPAPACGRARAAAAAAHIHSRSPARSSVPGRSNARDRRARGRRRTAARGGGGWRCPKPPPGGGKGGAREKGGGSRETGGRE